MKAKPYYFEIKDVVAQFLAAFDDIVIGRFNKERVEEDRINVRYLYAPKQRVMHDIINENKTITLPAVAVNINSVSRDSSRVFNKVDGFYYAGSEGNSTHIKSPVPINISVSVSVLTRYQTDMDQILSNFIPFANPYVIISWYVPKEFNLPDDQEIRSEVLWDGNVSLNYPVELASNQKARITADTSFTIKGWLFKDQADPIGNIFFIKQNFASTDVITEYDALESMDLPTESFELSGSPSLTNVFYNGSEVFDGTKVLEAQGTSGKVQLYGTSLSHTEGVLLSTNTNTIYTALTSIPATTRQPSISGQLIPFTILNDNVIDIQLPALSAGNIRVIPFNIAGYSSTDEFINVIDYEVEFPYPLPISFE